jgi:hypothetical protein
MPNRIKNHLGTLSPEAFASRYLFESIPYVFGTDLDAYIRWKAQLGRHLEVDPRAMAIIGSAGVGLSLAPNSGLKPFGPSSDIDVAVVSAHHFEIAWRHLRSLSGSVRMSLDPRQKEALSEHVTKLIYFGAVATDRILDLLPFAQPWLIGLSKMAGVDPTASRAINARVYRDFDSLRKYQMKSVRAAQEDLRASTKGKP